MIELSDVEGSKEAALSEQPAAEEAQAVEEGRALEETQAAGEAQVVEEAHELPPIPEPTATGNDKIDIVRHNMFFVDMERGPIYPTARIELAARNVSQQTIATAVFEAVCYDEEGNIIDTAMHKEIELRPDTSRLVHITTGIPVYESDRIATYAVRLLRATTTDVEKFHLIRYEASITDAGEERIEGVAKNLSDDKADVAIAVTFYDEKQETICTRVLVLKDVPPRTAKKFDLTFKPGAEDMVTACKVIVGEATA